jgi:hypothetical protein
MVSGTKGRHRGKAPAMAWAAVIFWVLFRGCCNTSLVSFLTKCVFYMIDPGGSAGAAIDFDDVEPGLESGGVGGQIHLRGQDEPLALGCGHIFPGLCKAVAFPGLDLGKYQTAAVCGR